MSIFNRYPYTDFHRLNADWILDKVKEAAEDAHEAAEAAASSASSVSEAVRYTEQQLTSSQQEQARLNIGSAANADVDALGTQVEQQQTVIQGHANILSVYGQRLNTTESDIDTLQEGLDQAQAEISSISPRVTATERDVSIIKNDTATLVIEWDYTTNKYKFFNMTYSDGYNAAQLAALNNGCIQINHINSNDDIYYKISNFYLEAAETGNSNRVVGLCVTEDYSMLYVTIFPTESQGILLSERYMIPYPAINPGMQGYVLGVTNLNQLGLLPGIPKYINFSGTTAEGNATCNLTFAEVLDACQKHLVNAWWNGSYQLTVAGFASDGVRLRYSYVGVSPELEVDSCKSIAIVYTPSELGIDFTDI